MDDVRQPLNPGAPRPANPPAGKRAGPAWLPFVLPWAMFTMIVGFFTYAYYHAPSLVWMVVLMCAVFSTMFHYHPNEKVFYARLSVLCWTAVCLGVLGGLGNYYWHMATFWAHDDAREYDNVLPSQPAAAHMDAGVIEFAVSAHIDTTKTAPYHQGTTYCVAPILDRESEASSRVEFWAVGTNCCEEQVFTCDDAGVEGKASPHGGLVVMDDGLWTIANYDMYHKAVKQAEATFDIVSSSEPMFIRWVSDPSALQTAQFGAGTGMFFLYSLLHLLINGVLAFTSQKMVPNAAPAQKGLA